MSRSVLAKGICSEKTIYYIEKEQRSPSVTLLGALGNRLGIDLFEYLPYMDYQEPLKVKEALEKLEQIRSSLEVEALSQYLNELEQLPDFKKEPLSDYIEYSRLFCHLMRAADDKFYKQLSTVLEKRKINLNKQQSSMSQLEDHMDQRYVNLVGIYYMKKGWIEEGLSIFTWLFSQVGQLKDMRRFREHYIAIGLNYLHVLRINEKFVTLLEEAQSLIQYMKTVGSIDKLPICFWFRAIAYRKQGFLEEASLEIARMAYSGFLKWESKDLKSVMNQAEFAGILNFLESDEAWLKSIELHFWNNSSIVN